VATAKNVQDVLEKLPLDDLKVLLDIADQLHGTVKAKIPGGITLDHYKRISEFLVEVRKVIDAMQVVARVNETDKEEPAPVFVGWVEDSARARIRLNSNDPAPGLLRAGDTEPSTTYELCFLNKSGRPLERDWTIPEHVYQRRANELCLSQKTGVNYLRVMPIVVSEHGRRRCVGVLGAGFSQRPDNMDEVDEALRAWAQSEERDLVPYLKKTFQLGGRFL
jgi:hypothetical protein